MREREGEGECGTEMVNICNGGGGGGQREGIRV